MPSVDLRLPPPAALLPARLQAHFAAQLPAAVGALLEPKDDFSHTALTWDDALGALVSAPLPSAAGARAALLLGQLRLHVVGKDRTLASLELDDKSPIEALAWLDRALRELGATASPAPPAHELPAHPLRDGAAFTLDGPALEQLAAWFALADGVLHDVVQGQAGASPVRCWPHHFDIATLIALDAPSADPERARSIGAGLSPGDGTYDMPYVYVTPWPYPDDADALPALEAGRWHTEGFVAAVLEATDVDPDAPAESVRAFVAASVDVCRGMLAP